MQNEYRQANESSNLIADFGFVNGYKNNNRSHILQNIIQSKFKEFEESSLSLQFEQVSNDTYLKVFDAYITNSKARPNNFNVLNNKIKLNLSHVDYNFSTGVEAYENLSKDKNSDRYEYVLPHYSFDTVLKEKIFDGSLSIYSSGSNALKNTNELNSNITNNINYTSNNFITGLGFNNNYNFYLKNHNVIGKKSTTNQSQT